jgi:acetyl-CoA carboxylase biotin carboxyl carrier protein
MNITQIQDLIKFVSKSGVSEVEIEQKDFKITIKTHEPVKKGQEIHQIAVCKCQLPLLHQLLLHQQLRQHQRKNQKAI